jgi:C-terminal processing protease CtpA/Prc
MMQTVPAQALRGRTIRLQARVRATTGDASSGAAIWLRVDRSGGTVGFFDNMGGRGIRASEWREYTIEGPVADDAEAVAFGAMAGGAVTADFDDVVLSVRSAEGSWTAVPIDDPGFEGDGLFSSKVWRRVGTSPTAAVSRIRGNAPEGNQHLRLAPGSLAPATEELFDAEPVRGRHVVVSLGQMLSARVPLALSNEEAARHGSDLDALRAAIGSLPAIDDVPDIDARLAGVAVAWNVFRHFYPYWTEAGQQWDSRLEPLLDLALRAKTRAAYRDALRQLVADVSDGHGGVIDTRRADAYGRVPIRLALVEETVVVTATAVGEEVPVGATITAIDGEPAAARLRNVMQLTSGTPQWKQARALQEMTMCEKGTMVTLALVTPGGSRTTQLRCDLAQLPAESRPAAVVELTPGIWYVDITRASMRQIAPSLPEIARAAGVVFDMRGYPTDAGAGILPHLAAESENTRWMHVARIVGPFGETTGWNSFGWNLTPQSPRIAGRVVFMTDGRAISYAESVMGYVADLKLATIVGSTTAGTNGDVARFRVPGDFDITFTGMRVTRHDGQSPHHLVGVQPDMAIAATLAGLRQGRDEVLDRAVAVVRSR